MFFFKKTPIVINAFVNEHFTFANEYAPIISAKKESPVWWKNTKRSKYDFDIMEAETTVRSCPGIINSLQTGFIVPLWCDIALKYDKDRYEFHSSDRMTSVSSHTTVQSPGFYDDHWHFKINSPWLVRSPIKLMYLSPIYHQLNPLPFVAPSGIITPMSNICPTNIFLFGKKTEQEERVMLKHLTPILQIIPLTQEPYTLKTEIISMSEYNKFNSIAGGGTSFATRGLKNINILKK